MLGPGFAVLMMGMLEAVPAVWKLGSVIHSAAGNDAPVVVPVWVYLLLLGALLHMAYAAYLLQLPHRAGLKLVAIVMVITAAVYALLLGVTLLAKANNEVLALLQLTVADLPAGSVEARPQTVWCLVMVVVTSLLAIWFGQSDEVSVDRLAANSIRR